MEAGVVVVDWVAVVTDGVLVVVLFTPIVNCIAVVNVIAVAVASLAAAEHAVVGVGYVVVDGVVVCRCFSGCYKRLICCYCFFISWCCCGGEWSCCSWSCCCCFCYLH